MTGFFHRIQERRAAKRLEKEIVWLARYEMDNRLSDKSLTNETKDLHRKRLFETVEEIINSENPFLKMRERLAYYVDRTSWFNVLVRHRLDNDGKPIAPYAHPALSWLLSDHLEEIAETNDSVRKMVASLPSRADLPDFILLNYELNHAYMSSINAVRVAMKDCDERSDRNWFREFYLATCIWREDDFRKEIGLPSLLKDDGTGLGGTKYWSFADFVKTGERFPHLAWQGLYESPFWKNSAIEGDSIAKTIR